MVGGSGAWWGGEASWHCSSSELQDVGLSFRSVWGENEYWSEFFLGGKRVDFARWIPIGSTSSGKWHLGLAMGICRELLVEFVCLSWSRLVGV